MGWMKMNELKLKSNKMEVLLLGQELGSGNDVMSKLNGEYNSEAGSAFRSYTYWSYK